METLGSSNALATVYVGSPEHSPSYPRSDTTVSPTLKTPNEESSIVYWRRWVRALVRDAVLVAHERLLGVVGLDAAHVVWFALHQRRHQSAALVPDLPARRRRLFSSRFARFLLRNFTVRFQSPIWTWKRVPTHSRRSHRGSPAHTPSSLATVTKSHPRLFPQTQKRRISQSDARVSFTAPLPPRLEPAASSSASLSRSATSSA